MSSLHLGRCAISSLCCTLPYQFWKTFCFSFRYCLVSFSLSKCISLDSAVMCLNFSWSLPHLGSLMWLSIAHRHLSSLESRVLRYSLGRPWSWDLAQGWSWCVQVWLTRIALLTSSEVCSWVCPWCCWWLFACVHDLQLTFSSGACGYSRVNLISA